MSLKDVFSQIKSCYYFIIHLFKECFYTIIRKQDTNSEIKCLGDAIIFIIRDKGYFWGMMLLEFIYRKTNIQILTFPF